MILDTRKTLKYTQKNTPKTHQKHSLSGERDTRLNGLGNDKFSSFGCVDVIPDGNGGHTGQKNDCKDLWPVATNVGRVQGGGGAYDK